MHQNLNLVVLFKIVYQRVYTYGYWSRLKQSFIVLAHRKYHVADYHDTLPPSHIIITPGQSVLL